MTIPNTTFRAFIEKIGDTEATTFIGNEGDLFYDPNTSSLRVSDGTTPGGVPVADGSAGVVTALNDIGNVDVPSPTDGQVLAYNTTTGEWEAVDSTPSITESASLVSIEPPENSDIIQETSGTGSLRLRSTGTGEISLQGSSGNIVNVSQDNVTLRTSSGDINFSSPGGDITSVLTAGNILLFTLRGEMTLHADDVDIEGNLNVINGGVISGDGSGITNISDTRWKTGISTIGIGMSFIEQVNPIRFQYQKPVAGIDTITSTPELPKWDYSQGWELRDSQWRFGFSAQEISSIEQSIGGQIGIAITDNPEQYQMRTEAMLPILVNAMKELKAELDTALARIDQLENP